MRFRSWIVLALLILLVCEAPAAAQTTTPSKRPFSIAVAGGLNSATITLPADMFFDVTIPELDFSIHRLTGFVGGVLIGFPVAPPVTFETGALLSVKGVRIKLSEPGITGTGDVRTTYLDLPALARVGFYKSGATTAEVLGGVTTGLLLSARSRVTANGVSESESITSELPAVDFGLTIGGRVTVGRIFGDVRYIHGLRNLEEDSGDVLKHRVWQFMGGWRF